MKLTILGSGNSYPNPTRGQSAFCLETGDYSCLVDAGEGVSTALESAGIDWRNLDAVYLTHYHTDHVAGLVPFLFSLYLFAERQKDLTIFGPDGLNRYMDAQESALAEWLGELPFPLRTQQFRREIQTGVTDKTEVASFLVPHKDMSVGYRFEHQGRIVAFSGDTAMSPNLLPLARGADLFCCESGYPDEADHPNHISWTQIGEVAEQAGVRHLVLTHIGKTVDIEKMVVAIRAGYSGKITPSEDGMSFEV